MPLFHHVRVGGFLLLALGCGTCNTGYPLITPRASPATTGEQAEQHNEPIGSNKIKTSKVEMEGLSRLSNYPVFIQV
jgi:hypothetical protein